jgi:hypothetical protein
VASEFESAALDYLRSHGIKPEIALEAGVRSEGDSLVYTVTRADGSTFERRRPLSGNRTFQPQGEPLTPWRPCQNGAGADMGLVTEGEGDALAAVTALREAPLDFLRELPVFAVPGTGYPVERLAAELCGSYCEVWLAFDGDEAGRSYQAKAAKVLAAAGIRPIPVELPPGRDLAECVAAADDPGDWLANALVDAEAEAQVAVKVPSAISSHASHISYLPSWPAPLREVAFHGPAGRFVGDVEPQSEADPAGLLAQYLAAAGNLAGAGVRCRVESDCHPPRLYVLLVGDTAKARKGTAWGRVRDVAERVDSEWAGGRIMGGLASGEGLIAQLRDPTPDDEGNTPEPTDRRLLVVEGEFARVLKVGARESNTLSPVLRTLWDRGDARTMTRNDPLRATGAHVSITAHITERELRSGLSEVEIANGFANRFQFVSVRRSKLLPRGGNLSRDVLERCGHELSIAIEHAHKLGEFEIDFDREAGERWEDAYRDMAVSRYGLLGAVTARAEAQVVRLAVTYAILDCSREIKLPHLEAALEVWRYCEQSAAHIFGEATGDRLADRLLAELREAGSRGLSRTEVRDRVGSNAVPAERIELALATLRAGRLAECRVEGGGRGRPVERWMTVSVLGDIGAIGAKGPVSSHPSYSSQPAEVGA